MPGGLHRQQAMDETLPTRCSSRGERSSLRSDCNSSYSDQISANTSTIVIHNGYDADNSSGSAVSSPDIKIIKDEEEDALESYLLEIGAVNTNNNVIREPLRVSRSATEVFVRSESALQLHQNRQNRKGQTSAKSVGNSTIKPEPHDYNSFKYCEAARKTKSCTLACDIMTTEYKKPPLSLNEDDSDINTYYANFTSGSVSLSDFSQNSGSVSSRNFNDDDDDDEGEDDDDDNDVENARGSHGMNELNCSVMNEENRIINSGNSGQEKEFSNAELSISTVCHFPMDDMLDVDNLDISLAAPLSSLTSDLTGGESTFNINESVSETSTATPKSLTFSNNSIDNSIGIDKPGPMAGVSREKGDYRNRIRNELRKSENASSARGFDVVEISLDGVTNDNLVKPSNTSNSSTDPIKQGKPTSMTSQARSAPENDDISTSLNAEEFVSKPSLSQSLKQSNIMKSGSKERSLCLVNIPEDDSSTGERISPSTEIHTGLKAPYQSYESLDNTPCTSDQTCVEDKRIPLPQDIMEAIQRAVANGDFDDVKSVEVDGNGYLLRYAKDKDDSQSTTIEQEGCFRTLPSHTTKGKSEDKKADNTPVIGVSSFSNMSVSSSALGTSQHDIKVLSISDESFVTQQENTYQRREHNDIYFSGRKIDVMSEGSSVSLRVKSHTTDKEVGIEVANNRYSPLDKADARINVNENPEVKTHQVKHKGENSCASHEHKMAGKECNENERSYLYEGRLYPLNNLHNPDKRDYDMCYVSEHGRGVKGKHSPTFQRWPSPEEYQIDCMDPIINDEASGDYVIGLGDKMKSPLAGVRCGCLGKSGETIKYDTNGNKLVTDSSSCLKESCRNDNREMSNKAGVNPEFRTTSSAEYSKTEMNHRRTTMRLSKETARAMPTKGEVVKPEGSGRKGRPRSKTKFLSLLLNMMDDDKDQKQNTAGTSKKHRDSDQSLSHFDEPEVESSEKALSFPRGIDSIEPNDNHWWSCAKEDLEMSYRQARRARRRLMLKKSRLGRGKKRDTPYEIPQQIVSDQSLSPDGRFREDILCEAHDSCQCCLDLSMSKEMRSYMSRINIKFDGKMERGAYNSQDQMMTYAKAAESFVKPDNYSSKYFSDRIARMNRDGECECDEDGPTWMAEGRTPFSQEGDRYSLLEDYYSRKSEDFSIRFAQTIASGDQTEEEKETSRGKTPVERIDLKRNSARISKRRFHAPSVMESDRLKRLSLDGDEDKSNQFNIKNNLAKWDYPRIENYLFDDEDSLLSITLPKGGLHNSKWRFKNTPTISSALGMESENGDSEMREEQRSRYIDLLHSKARIEIDRLNKIEEERIKARKLEGINREQNAKKKVKPDNVKVVRFSDVGVKTVKNTEHQWNSTVNEMLLKSEKVKGGSRRTCEGSKYPRSESAKKVSAVPEKTFNFLNELLEQDMQEQKMSFIGDSSYNEGIPGRSDGARNFPMELQIDGEAGGRNLPPLYRKSNTPVKIRKWTDLTNRSVQVHEHHLLREYDSARSPVSASSSGSKPTTSPSRIRRRRAHRSPFPGGSEGARQSLSMKLSSLECQKELQEMTSQKAMAAKVRYNSRGKKIDPSIPPSESFQLGKYSDVFNFYVSPYLRDRADTSIVQMYQK